MGGGDALVDAFDLEVRKNLSMGALSRRLPFRLVHGAMHAAATAFVLSSAAYRAVAVMDQAGRRFWRSTAIVRTPSTGTSRRAPTGWNGSAVMIRAATRRRAHARC